MKKTVPRRRWWRDFCSRQRLMEKFREEHIMNPKLSLEEIRKRRTARGGLDRRTFPGASILSSISFRTGREKPPVTGRSGRLRSSRRTALLRPDAPPANRSAPLGRNGDGDLLERLHGGGGPVGGSGGTGGYGRAVRQSA